MPDSSCDNPEQTQIQIITPAMKYKAVTPCITRGYGLVSPLGGTCQLSDNNFGVGNVGRDNVNTGRQTDLKMAIGSDN